MFNYFSLKYDFLDRKISYCNCQREPGTWIQEIENSAKLIAESTKKDIWICLSGGVDSEIVATTFKNLGIPFRILIVKFENEYNAHDVFWAHRWAETNKIPYEVVEFDMYGFIMSGHKQYLKEDLVSNNLFRYFCIELLKIVEGKNGYAILGGKSYGISLAQQELNQVLDDKTVYDQYDIGSLAPIEWSRKNGTDHCLFFYQSTPEIHKAYLTEPINQFVINNPAYLRSPGSNEAFKTAMIRGLFPAMATRPKYHGFEKIYQLRETCQIEMAKYFELDSDVSNKRFKKIFHNNMISIKIEDVLNQLK